eukprot:PhM_4_TR1676/c0_g1_i1/m.2257
MSLAIILPCVAIGLILGLVVCCLRHRIYGDGDLPTTSLNTMLMADDVIVSPSYPTKAGDNYYDGVAAHNEDQPQDEDDDDEDHVVLIEKGTPSTVVATTAPTTASPQHKNEVHSVFDDL